MYLTPGRNPTIELLRSEIPCHKVFLETNINKDEKISEIIDLAKQKRIEVVYKPRPELEKMLPRDSVHQGVIGVAERFAPELNLNKLEIDFNSPTLYIYIREAQYDHNVGAIIRTAECLGANGIILPPKVDIDGNTTRLAMGANFHIPVTQNGLFPTIKIFKKLGFQTIGIEINGEGYIKDVDWSLPSLLIVGGEDRSISDEISKQLDRVVQIKQFGKVNSLNMSVAAALAIYERARQL